MQRVMLVAQRAHTTGLEDQTRVGRNVRADPAARQRTQDVAVGDDEHVVRLRHAAGRPADRRGVEALADLGDEGVEAGGDLFRGSVRDWSEIFLERSLDTGGDKRHALIGDIGPGSRGLGVH